MRTGTENQIELLLLRHGATASNAEGRFLGQTDEPLSGEGSREILLKKENLKGQSPQLVFSSPMTRCRETARLLFDVQPVIVPDWTEMDFGRFEGKNYLDLDGDPEYQAWIDSGGTLPFPGGESREQFSGRCLKGLERMLEEIGERVPGEGVDSADPVRAAAVVHGGTIMALMSALTGGEYFDYQVKNGEGYFLTLAPDDSGSPALQNYYKA